MSSKGQTYLPFGNNLPPGTININHGGTGCTTVQGVVKKFNAITKDSLGANGGIASFTGGTGKIGGNQINKTAIKQAISYLVTTYEQGYLNIGQSIYFTIEGYDKSINYSISVDKGTYSRENNVITITAPTTPGSMTLTFNGKKYTFEVIKSELATPSITSPANNATGIMPATTFTSSKFTIQREDAPTSTHSMSSWQLSKSKDFKTANIIKSSMNDTTNKNMWSVTGMPFNTTLYVRVRYRNSNGIWSDWSTPITFKTIQATVNTPSITSPANNTTLTTVDSINLVSSAVSINGGNTTTFPHIGTDWQVSTNSTFTAIVKSVTNSSTNKTSWTATGLTKNTTYYVRVRYNITTLGYSAWSSTVKVTTANYFTDASGRTFYRHKSGMGTVMGWVDKKGVKHQTLVLDASYRNVLPWANPSNYNFDVSGLTNYTNSWYYLCSGTTSRTSTDANTYQAATESAFYFRNKTDAQINALSGYFEDTGTSKNNTNAMMSNSNLNSTGYAAGFCRSKKVNGTACDLPNIQTLIRIYCSMFKLDELDPTATGNRYLFTKARSGNIYNWYMNNATNDVWSSSGYGSYGAWYVGYGGYTDGNGKTNAFGVVPVLEL